ncbi:MAG TPA: hemolysin family protein [Rectinemataceae bacterium]
MSIIGELFSGKKQKPENGAEEPTLRERKRMIEGVEQLGETTVKEVMVPRTDTVFLDQEATAEETYSVLLESGHSRIPVYHETIDNVIGVLYAKDVLACLVGGKPFSLSALARKAFFVPETKRIDSLLREFKRRHVHIAIVVDEYGGTAGIVCLEDIIEEIVGEIQDEFDNEPEDISPVGPKTWQCDARLRLDQVSAVTGIELPDEDFDSLAGYVFDLFGRIPEEGESVDLRGARISIMEMDAHRILSVKIERLDAQDESSEVGSAGD